jgi:hypothetical protein
VWVLEHFNAWIADPQPDVLRVNCGLHDAAAGVYPDAEPQITLEQYALSLRRLVAKVRKDLPHARMIWATSTSKLRKIVGRPKRQWPFRSEVAAYNRAALAVMKTAGIPVNDLNRTVMTSGPFRCISNDACHMTAFGNARLARSVARAILCTADGERSESEMV